MAVSIRHRGPDHTGFHFEPHLGLVSTRLSILDLSHDADMPMWSPDRQAGIVYNGEVYNFRELREELVALGHSFHTTGDTEVLLHAWMEWGTGFLRRLNGMFGLCIYDVRNRRLLLARDRFGKKNIYYYLRGQTLAFASEAKALWAVFRDCLTLDDRAVLEYLATDHVMTSMFREIRALDPGEFIEFSVDSLEIVRQARYHTLADWVDTDLHREMDRLPRVQVDGEVSRRLREAVAVRLVSDAPLGVMCSGGVDSSLITLHAAERPERLEAFTVDIPGHPIYSELQYAAEVCRKAGAHLNVFNLERNDYLSAVVDNIYYNDIPPAHLGSSIGVYLISRMARERGIKVLLSGEGADETFCGYYGRYRRHHVRRKLLGLARLKQAVPRSVQSFFSDESVFDANLLKGIRYPDLAMVAARAAPKHVVYDELCERYREAGCCDPEVMAMSVMDMDLWIQSILLRTDRASMQASVEARIPFLDDNLTRLAVNLPLRWRVTAFQDKAVLKRLLAQQMGSRFAYRPKVGFGVVSYLRDFDLENLFGGGFVQDFFGPGMLRLASKDELLLNKLVILEIWHQVFCRGIPRDKVNESLGVTGRKFSSESKSSVSARLLSAADKAALATVAATGEGPTDSGFIRKGDATHFSATVASSLIGLISSVIAAKFLLPKDLGTIQTVMLIASYLAYMDLGVTSGLFRNMPLALGRGEATKVVGMVDAAWRVVKLVCLIGLAVSLGVMVWGFAEQRDALFGWSSLGLLALLAVGPIETFYVILFRGVQQFHVLGKRLHWKNAFMAVSTLLPAVAGAGGLIARNVLTPVVGVFLLKPGLPFRPSGKGSWREAGELAKVGLPILMVNILTSFLMAADRSVIALLLGPEAVGQYALASLVMAGLPVLPASLGAILYPRAAHDFGRGGSSRALRRFYWLSLLFNLAVLVPACAICYFLIPPAVHAFLPAYAPGIHTAQIACMSCLFLLYVGQANILVVVRRNLPYGLMLAAATALVWVVGWLLVMAGWSIEGVAVGRLIANAVLCVCVVAYAGYLVWKDIKCED